MVEKQRNNVETKENGDFLKDSYFVGDSLSVGITNGYQNFEGSVKGGKQTKWMLEQVQKNEANLKNKKVMFLLGGTNDIFSNKKANQIIENIDKIAQITERNGVKIIVGTIPPFDENKGAAKKNLGILKTTGTERMKVINEVNNYIKSKYNFIDNSNFIISGDGIHSTGVGYKNMQEAQKQKFQEIIGNQKEQTINLNNDFEKYFSDNIGKQNWFLELSVEKQAELKLLYKEKFNIEKKLISYNSKKDLSSIDYSGDFSKMTNEERIDMIEREIDLLNRELYKVELAIEQDNLNKDADIKAGVFEADMSSSEYQKMSRYIEGKKLKDITSGELYSLKLIGYDLSRLFLKGNGNDTTSRDNMKVGDIFTVNFGKNKDLNKNIGIGDLLPIDKFETIKVNGVLGTRKDLPRPGYYDEKGTYLSIYDNYKVELVSEKKYSIDEEGKYKQSFQSRYTEIRTPELVNMIYNYKGNSRDLHNLTKEEFNIVVEYSQKYFSNELKDININTEKQEITTKSGKNLEEVLNNGRTKELGRNYLKYEPQIDKVIAKYPQVGKENLIRLINHENGAWNPLIKAPGSSAYGLGQMINSTWATFGKGLNRNNPEHQLEATCKLLVYLMQRKKCSIHEALAYYNTGEGIMSISQKTLNSYYSKNPAITKKIPKGEPKSAKTYFTAAIAYYNDLSFEQAKRVA